MYKICTKKARIRLEILQEKAMENPWTKKDSVSWTANFKSKATQSISVSQWSIYTWKHSRILMSYLEWDEHEKENYNNRKNSCSFLSLMSKLYLKNTCDVWFSMHLSPSSYNLFKAHALLMEKSCRSKHDSWHHKNKETRLLDQTQEAKLMKSLQVQSRLMKISVCCTIRIKRGWIRREEERLMKAKGWRLMKKA